jgi:hypothetical protein
MRLRVSEVEVLTRRVMHRLPDQVMIADVLTWCRDNSIPALLAVRSLGRDGWNIRGRPFWMSSTFATSELDRDSLIVRECDYPLVRLRW